MLTEPCLTSGTGGHVIAEKNDLKLAFYSDEANLTQACMHCRSLPFLSKAVDWQWTVSIRETMTKKTFKMTRCLVGLGSRSINYPRKWATQVTCRKNVRESRWSLTMAYSSTAPKDMTNDHWQNNGLGHFGDHQEIGAGHLCNGQRLHPYKLLDMNSDQRDSIHWYLDIL